jgi:hypothetical protein
VSRDKLDENSIVQVDGMKVQIKTLVAIGKLAAKPGGGFEWVKEAGPAEQPQAPQSEYLDRDTEAVLGEATNRLGGSTVLSLVDRVVTGKSIAEVNELASRLGVEPADVHARIGTITRAFQGQAQRALGFDVDTFATFSAWAQQNHSKESLEAIRQQVGYADLSGIKKLAEAFKRSGAAWNEQDVLEADFGDGVTAHRDSRTGKIIMTIDGEGSMTFQDAVRYGRINVARNHKR